MPDQKALNALTFIASKNPADIQDVRLAGVTKPFEQLTISEPNDRVPARSSWP
jgi:hypothetical protein